MFNNSVRRWIPENLLKQDLFQQFADSIDWLLSANYPHANKLSDRFEAIKSKYTNLQDVPLEDIYTILEETGYKYITDVLALDEDSLRTFLSFLTFIHIYKGTRRGLEFALRLLNTEFELKEWYEVTPVEEVHTFNITLLKFQPESIAHGFDILTKLVNFTRNYVYPVLKKLHVEFSLPDGFINIGVSNVLTMHINFYDELDTLKWDEGNWNEAGWGT